MGIIDYLLAHPSAFFDLVAQAIAPTALMYGVSWLFLRTKGLKIQSSFSWHLLGVVASATGVALIEVVAIGFFGYASVMTVGSGTQAFCSLVVPFFFSIPYIKWLMSKLVISNDTASIKVWN